MYKPKMNHLLKRCVSAIVYGVGGAAGSRVLMFLANILLSRILGQEFFGQFSSVSSTVNLFVTFSGMGVSATLTCFVAAYRDDSRRLGIYIRTLSSICMVMSIVLSLSLFLFAGPISQFSTGTATLAGYFRIVAVSVFFASMAAVEQSVLVGFEQFRKSSLVQLIRCTLFCGLGYIFSRLWGIHGAVYALLISHGAQYFLSLAINQKYYRTHGIRPVWQWNSELKQATFHYAVPAFLSGLFVMPVNWLGNAMLTRSTSFSQMAIFTVCNQWMQYITYIPSQMGQMRPIYTDLYVKGEHVTLRRLVCRVSLSTTAVVSAVCLMLCLMSDFILPVYGAAYISGKPVFLIMVLTAVFYTAQVQTGFILQATNKMWLAVMINCTWGVSLIASYAAMLDLGAVGYAIAFCLSYSIILIIQWFIVIRVLWKKQLPG